MHDLFFLFCFKRIFPNALQNLIMNQQIRQSWYPVYTVRSTCIFNCLSEANQNTSPFLKLLSISLAKKGIPCHMQIKHQRRILHSRFQHYVKRICTYLPLRDVAKRYQCHFLKWGCEISTYTDQVMSHGT